MKPCINRIDQSRKVLHVDVRAHTSMESKVLSWWYEQATHAILVLRRLGFVWSARFMAQVIAQYVCSENNGNRDFANTSP